MHIIDVLPEVIAPPRSRRRGICGSKTRQYLRIGTAKNNPAYWLNRKNMCGNCALLIFSELGDSVEREEE